MQTIESLYDLYVSYDKDTPQNREDYGYIQGLLDHNLPRAAQVVEQNGKDFIGIYPIGNNNYFTFCAKNGKLHMGICDENGQNLHRHCALDEIRNLTKKQVENMSYRICNYALTKLEIHIETDLKDAWDKELPIIAKEHTEKARSDNKLRKVDNPEFDEKLVQNSIPSDRNTQPKHEGLNSRMSMKERIENAKMRAAENRQNRVNMTMRTSPNRDNGVR